MTTYQRLTKLHDNYVDSDVVAYLLYQIQYTSTVHVMFASFSLLAAVQSVPADTSSTTVRFNSLRAVFETAIILNRAHLIWTSLVPRPHLSPTAREGLVTLVHFNYPVRLCAGEG